MTRSHKAARDGNQRLTMRLGGALVVVGVVMVAPGLVSAAAAVGGGSSPSPSATSTSAASNQTQATAPVTTPPAVSGSTSATPDETAQPVVTPTTSAPAAPASPLAAASIKCDNALTKSGGYNGDLFNYWFNGPLSQGWVSLKPGVTICEDSVYVGIAAYTAPKKTYSTPQDLFDAQVATIDNTTRSVSLHADSPDCYQQIDLFFGRSVLKKIISGGELYGDRMVSRAGATPVSHNGSSPVPARQSWYNGGVAPCTTSTPTPTDSGTPTTPPPTTTTAPPTTTTAPPTSTTVTESTPTPTETNPSTLPHTGGPDGLRNIALTGLLAVNAGIGLLWWGSRPARRH